MDASGCAYVVGETASADASQAPPGVTPFPTKVGPDTTYNGAQEVFVAKVNAAGTGLDYCGYIGGASGDSAAGIAVDPKGCAYVVGMTYSNESTFPVRVGPRLTKWPAVDGFVAKVNAAGTALDYCGYCGGAGGNHEALFAVAVDQEGHAYLAGVTEAPETRLPLTVGPFLQRSGVADALVAKLSPSGASFVYCGLIGGSGTAAGADARAIAVDAQGNAFVAGSTGGTGLTFPVKEGPQLVARGLSDAWVAMIDSSGRFLRYCGFIGGAYDEVAEAIAVTPAGSAFVAGWTMTGEMSGFPVTVGPDLTHNLGGTDAFIARIGFTEIVPSGSGQIGRTVTFAFTATEAARLPYQAGSSLGTGPIPIDQRQLFLSPDDLLVISVSGLWPWIFQGYRGVLDAQGQAQLSIHIPNVPALAGTRIHTAFIALDPAAPSGIRVISATETITITN